MNIKILYDNKQRYGFEYGWGFSALIDNRIMFDMGESDKSLRANCDTFGVDLAAIEVVVISHGDWDHIGGLGLLRKMPGVKSVYLPAACPFSVRDTIRRQRPETRVIPVRAAVPIEPGTTVTRQLGWKKKEISLVLSSDQGGVLLTGCAHPGLGRILSEARLLGPVHAVIGGFHGFRTLAALSGIETIVVAHCTRRKQAILARYPTQAREGAAGMELEISAVPNYKFFELREGCGT
jgi:7,8-dihydropterin-6-yl-methyl-4-(beta-D-ribofuranosyl)aminobenzene 5'-phosphate synthase